MTAVEHHRPDGAMVNGHASGEWSGLERLERLEPRVIWGDQEPDLTPWLIENLDVIGDTLGLQITPVQREARVSDLALNVLGEDQNGRPVIIENRLEAASHTQLGQLLVFASAVEAAVIVWVAPRFSEEHLRVLDWLNTRTDPSVDFFAIELSLVRIGRSAPAPVFDVVLQPRDWGTAGAVVGGALEVAELHHRFFVSMFESITRRRPGYRVPDVGYDNWVGFFSGPFGFYDVSFTASGGVRAGILLDTQDQASTKELFDDMVAERMAIETAIGRMLIWERLDEHRACRVYAYRELVEMDDEGAFREAAEWAAETITTMMDVLDTRLRSSAHLFLRQGELP
ncbi:MAG TPA: DUF4268 domain-containing protein [Actinomycetes bacterium]|nr:DUF4268 domain-containing protein [Actinomycetes bacterium]